MLLLWSFHIEDFKYLCFRRVWSDALGIPRRKRIFASAVQAFFLCCNRHLNISLSWISCIIPNLGFHKVCSAMKNLILQQSLKMRDQVSKHLHECPAKSTFAQWETNDVLCWHFLSDSGPNQDVTASWCLLVVLQVYCCRCCTQEDRCWQVG